MDLWYPFAVRRDGPAWKIGYGEGQVYSLKKGEVKHSAVGFHSGMMSELDGVARKSWHFSILYDGKILQHYPITANCWHAGDADPDGAVSANIDLVGIEHEGGHNPVNEPLKSEQLSSTINLSRWLMEQFNYRIAVRYPVISEGFNWWLVEHKQVGDFATQCPSDRIPWDIILQALNTPQTTPPTPRDLAYALDFLTVSYVHNRPLTDLHPFDQQTLRWAANYIRDLLPGG